MEHEHALAQAVDHAEVVGDEHEAEAELLDEVAQQVEDLRPHRHVERADRLVGDEHLRVRREGAGDGDALLLPAGELVRVAVAGVRVDADRR